MSKPVVSSKPTAKKRKVDEEAKKQKQNIVINKEADDDVSDEDYDQRIEDDIDEITTRLARDAWRDEANLFYHMVNFINGCAPTGHIGKNQHAYYERHLNEYRLSVPNDTEKLMPHSGDKDVFMARIMKVMMLSDTTDEMRESLCALLSK